MQFHDTLQAEHILVPNKFASNTQLRGPSSSGLLHKAPKKILDEHGVRRGTLQARNSPDFAFKGRTLETLVTVNTVSPN